VLQVEAIVDFRHLWASYLGGLTCSSSLCFVKEGLYRVTGLYEEFAPNSREVDGYSELSGYHIPFPGTRGRFKSYGG
jgi:hypothetical protein